MASRNKALMDPTLEASSSTPFLPGLRVLVVDDDIVSLTVLKMCLLRYHYHVTTCTRGEQALAMLRENRGAFDIVMLDVHMPHMNGLQLLVIIGLEMDIPVLMISADSRIETVMEGISHGACDYIVKPFSPEHIRNIWVHVARRRNAAKNKRRRGDGEEEEEEEEEDIGEHHPKKMPRVWNAELRQKFLDVIDVIGVDMASPKIVLEMMGVPCLTKRQVASHLQKYRNYVRKNAELGASRPTQISENVLARLSTQILDSNNINVEQDQAAAGGGAAAAILPNAPPPAPEASNYNHHSAGGSGCSQNVKNNANMIGTVIPADTARAASSEQGGPKFGADKLEMQQQQTLVVPSHEWQGVEAIVQYSAGECTTSSGTNASFPEYGYSDEDEILREDLLVRLFNSSTDDAFL